MRVLSSSLMLMVLTWLCTSYVHADDNPAADAPAPLEILRQILDPQHAPVGIAERRKEYESAVERLLPLVKANVLVTGALDAAIAQVKGLPDAEALAVLQQALSKSQEVLAFEPLMEAKLPEGFPQPTPVREVRVKKYPEYRLARTAMDDANGRAFWTLFMHIQKNHIKMTAPVEMTYGKGAKAGDKPEQMAFLYQSMQLGQEGKQDDVDVVNVPAMTTVSIGMQGSAARNLESVEQARTLLEAWLREHAADYSTDGPLRVMGYNSPFVPFNRSYFEVEFPVRKTAGAETATQN